MIESVRARLTLWFTGVFAVFLTLFGVAAYTFLGNTTLARIDEYLADTADAVAGALEAGVDQPGVSRTQVVDAVMREYRFRDIGVGIYDQPSRALLASHPARHDEHDAETAGPLPALPPEVAGRREYLTTVPGANGGTRMYSQPVELRGGTLLVVTTRALGAHAQTLREARDVMLVALPLALGLAAFGGYLFVRQTLHPVVAMSDRAAQIGASTLHERLPVPAKRDELGRLAEVFNGLLRRLDASFDQQRQFMADASHELRTPVAIIAGEAALALERDDRSTEQLRTALMQVHDQSRRMRRIVEDLFLLARADAGEQPLERAALYLDELAAEVTQSLRTIAERKRITLDFGGDSDLALTGDENLLRRLLTNLVDNAIKYTPEGGCVSVRAERAVEGYVVRVRDTGIGIPAEAQPHIFDRFFRVDPGRNGVEGSGSGAGAGLGLSIARWIAEAHGGRLVLVRSGKEGSEFVVELQ